MNRLKLFASVLLMVLVLHPAISATEPKNILLICVDDLRPELNSFGVSYIHSPNIDRLAALGRPFLNHYVNAPSCGPSRFTLLTGRYGPGLNQALFERAAEIAKHPGTVPPSMPEWFRQHGYTTVSVGKVSHHPGGLGGVDWNDPDVIEMPEAWDRNLMPVGEWQHPRGAMHGLANGEIRKSLGVMDVFQTVEGPDTIYPDGLIMNEGIRQLEELAVDPSKPFFLAVGLLKPHLPFGAPGKYMTPYEELELPLIPHPDKPRGKTTWNDSDEFMDYYNHWGKDPRTDAEFATEVRRHYAACVSYADAQVGRLLETLEKTGADKNTVVVLWGDHGWNLGEHAIWGKHNLFEEALRSPLVIYTPGMASPGRTTGSLVETLDIFPTLCELAKLPVPGFAQGISLAPVLENPESPGHPALAYWGKSRTIRTRTHRLTVHGDGGIELYDHTSVEKETLNVAEQNPELVRELQQLLSEKFSR